MILVGIDVSKDKHDCFISTSDGEVLFDVFTIANTMDGFSDLYEKISSVADDFSKVKVGLEATGHYSYNILGFVLNKGLTTYVINPLHTNLFRKGQSLRKTKTDKVDAASIAMMLLTDRTLKPYSDTSYHNEELKSLTRYRFDKVQERARLKTSVTRLVSILFPELLFVFIPTNGCLVAAVGFVVIGTGMGPVYPAIQHMAPTNFGKRYSAAVIGLQMASAYVGSTFMPMVFGHLQQAIGIGIMPLYLLVFAVMNVGFLELTYKVIRK